MKELTIKIIANNDKRIKSIDSLETYAYGHEREEILYVKKEEIRCSHRIKQYRND